MPALNHDLDQATIDQSSQMHCRSGRRHSGTAGQFTGRQRSTVNQRGEHRRSGRIAEQRTGGRQVDALRFLDHVSSMPHAHFDARRKVVGLPSGFMDTDPTTRTASADDAAFIYREWDARTRAHDIEGLLELYTPDAILETPLIARILDRRRGVLTGREQIRPFFQRGTDNRPNELVRWHRTGRYHFDGQTLMWEYPRAHPDGGDQVDLAEVMDLNGPQITHHRIYWGWFGTPLLIPSTGSR